MAEPVQIAIVLDGGCLQAVISAGVPVEFTLVDYDTDGADEGRACEVPQDGGGTATAIVYTSTAETGGPWVEMVRALAVGEPAEEGDEEQEEGPCSECGGDLAAPSKAEPAEGVCGVCLDAMINEP